MLFRSCRRSIGPSRASARLRPRCAISARAAARSLRRRPRATEQRPDRDCSRRCRRCRSQCRTDDDERRCPSFTQSSDQPTLRHPFPDLLLAAPLAPPVRRTAGKVRGRAGRRVPKNPRTLLASRREGDPEKIKPRVRLSPTSRARCVGCFALGVRLAPVRSHRIPPRVGNAADAPRMGRDSSTRIGRLRRIYDLIPTIPAAD